MLDKIRKMTGKDYVALCKIVFSFLPGKIYKLFHRDLWLVSERQCDARDNGYWFFRYTCENHKEQDICYAIDFSSPDYQKVKDLGKCVRFGSFRHHMLTWACNKFVSAHIGNGFPNEHICFNLLTMGVYSFKNAFLQHGVIKDFPPFLLAEKNKIDLFVTTAPRERDFVADALNYGETAQCLGLCRYDNLDREPINPRQILVMPTWRYWLAGVTEEEFRHSDYYKQYLALLQDSKLKQFAKKHDLQIIFFLHNEMQPYARLFHLEGVTVATKEEYDVQQALKESAFLVTDNSSIFFDFAYMNKPLCYYHFDYEEYTTRQYSEGYFSYERDGFGPVCKQAVGVVEYIISSFSRSFVTEETYQKRIDEFFLFSDRKNCKRNYEAVKRL